MEKEMKQELEKMVGKMDFKKIIADRVNAKFDKIKATLDKEVEATADVETAMAGDYWKTQIVKFRE